ncbi:MAG: histidine kinase dimerization/phosphoacceptor domain -containing protein [Bacteroidota bacterium]
MLLTLFATLSAHAQDYVVSLDSWGVKDGLSHREVNCIFKDREGFIWAGTANGLNRFDGYSFKVYHMQNSMLPFSNFTGIAQDNAGNIWLLGSNTGNNICAFNPVTEKAAPLPKGLPSQADFISKAPDGTIVIAYEKAEEFYSYSSPKGVSHIKIPGHGALFFSGISENGTAWFTDSHQRFYEYSLTGKLLKQVAVPFENSMGGVSKYTPGAGIGFNNLAEKKVYILDKEGIIKNIDYSQFTPGLKEDAVFYTGVNDVVWRQAKLYTRKEGLIYTVPKLHYKDLSGVTRAFCMVMPGDIWIGSSYGLYHLTIAPGLFKKLHYLQNIESTVQKNSFRGIALHRGSIISASEEGGLYSYNPVSGQQKALFSALDKSFTRFYAIASINSELYFAFETNMYRFDMAAKKPKLITRLEHDCWSIYKYTPDTLLLGTSKGLYLLNIKTDKSVPFNRYGKFAGLAVTMVSAFKRAGNKLLICSEEGLYVADTNLNIREKYGHLEPGSKHLSPRNYNNAYVDNNENVWLATGGGLLKCNFDSGMCKGYTTANALSNNTIYAVEGDKFGMLWLSSDYGIMCFNPRTEQVKVFLTQQGVTHNEFNRISCCRDNNGIIYFGSLNGITVVDPARFRSSRLNAATMPLAITAAEKYDPDSNRFVDYTAALNRQNTIELPPSQQYFNVQLALLNYRDPQHTIYSYKLEGVDEQWHSQPYNNFNFGTFPYGEHTLHFKARAADGTESTEEKVIVILATAPLYLKKWFIAGEVMLALLIGITMYLSRTRRLTREKQNLELVVQKRTFELQKLLEQKDVLMKETHHRVKNNLQVISALQQMQSNRSTDPQVKAALNESQNRVLSIAFIHHNLYQQTENIKGVEMHIFLNELVQHIADIFKNPGLTVNVERHVENIFLDIDSAVPLGLIMNELLTNSYKYAFKNTGPGSIGIWLNHLGNGRYNFTYTDSGPGLPPGTKIESANTLGLRLVKRLGRQLNGTSQYNNETGFHYNLVFEDYEARNIEK